MGLAPAPTGGNRTGRVFTGDKSADFLIRNLYRVGLTNQPYSKSIDDGLKIFNAYITAALKCVPPNNLPTREELSNCSPYLYDEIEFMKNLKAVLTLGKIAFDSLKQYFKSRGVDTRGLVFKHGAHYDIHNIRVFCSYHPSPRNVNTGVMTEDMFHNILKEISEYLRY